jgi:LPS-assembly lipoprotein
MSWFDLRLARGPIRKRATATVVKTLAAPLHQLRLRHMGRFAVVALLAALTAGCFQPMYAARSDGSPALRERLASVEIPPLNYPQASREARVGLNIRNALMFSLWGDGEGGPKSYTLSMRLTTSRNSLIVDPNTALPEFENYGIDVTFELKEIATGKSVLTGTTFTRVSYDIPGLTQRFAKNRALRDAEDRAAKTIADNITTRLASFFYAGS